VRNLGVYLDSDLSMKSHITKTCQAAHFHLRNIGKVRKLLDTKSTKTLVHQLITSRVDYCNAMLLGISDTSLHRLQKIQNKAAKMITRSSAREHVKPILKSLHWLPVKERVDYKIACLIYKCLNEEAPSYLSELVEVHAPSRSLRSGTKQLLKVPNHRLALSDQSISVGGPKLWNSLSLNLRMSSTFHNFRSLLKTELFKRAFTD